MLIYLRKYLIIGLIIYLICRTFGIDIHIQKLVIFILIILFMLFENNTQCIN